jgi:hypothetical protein
MFLRGERDSMRAGEGGDMRVYNVKLDWWSASVVMYRLDIFMYSDSGVGVYEEVAGRLNGCP